MRHFLIFMFVIFGAVLAVHFSNSASNSMPVLKVYAPSSFVSRWGAGPPIKDEFEKTCNCRLEWNDSGDMQILLQRMRSESNQVGADVVIGIDFSDVEKFASQFEWRPIDVPGIDIVEPLRRISSLHQFFAYDWGVLTMVVRKSETPKPPENLDDLLDTKWRKKISLADPRTSVTGFQFLQWLIQMKGEDEAFKYLQKLEPQVLSYSANWAAAYGLFTKGSAATAFSYTTSPLYHQIEEKNEDYLALSLSEPSPLQIEYLGIPMTCKNCDLAEKFVQFLLSKSGQKMVMEKNYMFPVVKNVVEDTPFAVVAKPQTLEPVRLLDPEEKERILKKWVNIRNKK